MAERTVEIHKVPPSMKDPYKVVNFTNITKEEFECYLDGKQHVFAPGQQKMMPAFQAVHFRKHLVKKIEGGKRTKTELNWRKKHPESVYAPPPANMVERSEMLAQIMTDVKEETGEVEAE